MSKKRLSDRLSDIALTILRPFVILALKMTFDIEASGIKISKEREEPFILVGNHVTTWDAFIAMYNINYPIRFVATDVAFLDFTKKISMGCIARTIRKRVGKNETGSMRKMLYYLNHGYAIGLYPEGDDTFYGETLDCFKVGKFIKKAGVDVIVVKQKGSHLTHPRWADSHAKRGKVFTQTEVLLTKQQIAEYKPDVIQDIIEKSIYHNEYEWQRNQELRINRKNRAEGVERLVYMCNSCGSVLTVKGIGNDINCSACGLIGTINEYGFIKGNQIDNLVDYKHYQYERIEKALESTFSFTVRLNKVDFPRLRRKKIGDVKVTYKDRKLHIEKAGLSLVFELEKMNYPVNTMKNSFSFDYEGESYEFMNIRNQFILYEMCRFLNGSIKTHTADSRKKS